MGKKKILVSAPYFQPVVEEYRPRFEERNLEVIIPPVKERLNEEELLQWIPGICGVISGDDCFTNQVFEAANDLRVISKWGTGIDSIDLVSAKKHGVVICNTPGAFTQPVADTVLGYVLCFARGLPFMDVSVKSGRWEKFSGFALEEKTLGIIGVGNIGKAVVRRAHAFDMKVVGYDIAKIPDEFLLETGLKMVGLEELLWQSDFVSLNCDLNSTSYHMLNESAFAKMKKSSYIVNTSRGAVVKETDLVRALSDGRIAGAALDVFEQEPLPSQSPLRKMSNCLLAPHNSNSSQQVWKRIHENTFRQLLAVLDSCL